MLKKQLAKAFTERKSIATAKQQSAYMRDLFPFLGLKRPVRNEIQKEIFKDYPIKSEAELLETLETLWDFPEREFHYAAMDLAKKYHKLWSIDSLNVFERLIRKKSWWDTVDFLAANCVGILIQRNPQLIPVMDSWIEDEEMWIRRSSLLFQLRWKEKTDAKTLFRYCEKTLHEKEFFIRKAIGWSLREFSKTDATQVKAFLEQHQVSGLALREASKYL